MDNTVYKRVHDRRVVGLFNAFEDDRLSWGALGVYHVVADELDGATLQYLVAMGPDDDIEVLCYLRELINAGYVYVEHRG